MVFDNFVYECNFIFLDDIVTTFCSIDYITEHVRGEGIPEPLQMKGYCGSPWFAMCVDKEHSCEECRQWYYQDVVVRLQLPSESGA